MEDKQLRRSLLEALQWASLRELPEPNDKDVWLCALALVSKTDGSKSYVAMRKNKNGENRVVKDFGSVSVIAKIDEIYPYIFLDSAYIPDFKGQKKEERIKWLLSNGVTDALEELSIKELNKKILNIAIQNQLKAL